MLLKYHKGTQLYKIKDDTR